MDEGEQFTNQSDWLDFPDMIPEITEKIIEHWKKYAHLGRDQTNLEFGPEEIKKCVQQWIILRSDGIRPNSALTILQEW